MWLAGGGLTLLDSADRCKTQNHSYITSTKAKQRANTITRQGRTRLTEAKHTMSENTLKNREQQGTIYTQEGIRAE